MDDERTAGTIKFFDILTWINQEEEEYLKMYYTVPGGRKIEFLFHIRGDVFILIYFLAKILIHNLNNFHKVKRKNCNKLGFLVQNL